MKINEETGEVNIGKTKVNLTKMEMKILVILNKPGIVTYKEIYYKLYGIKVNELSESDRRLIYEKVCRLRKKLANVIKIHRKNQYGYELEVTNGEV